MKAAKGQLKLIVPILLKDSISKIQNVPIRDLKHARNDGPVTLLQEYTGWFRRATLERIRQHIRVRFLALIPGEVARELELVEARSLQRFKAGKGVSASAGVENLQDEGNMTCLVPGGDSELAATSESNAQLGGLVEKQLFCIALQIVLVLRSNCNHSLGLSVP
jgi:hypothetical protein